MAYIRHKETKDNNLAEDNKAEANSRNVDSISTGDSGDGNISVNSRRNVTINNNQTSTEKEDKKRNVQKRINKTDVILS